MGAGLGHDELMFASGWWGKILVLAVLLLTGLAVYHTFWCGCPRPPVVCEGVIVRDSAGMGRDTAGMGRDSAGFGRDTAGIGRDAAAGIQRVRAIGRDAVRLECH